MPNRHRCISAHEVNLGFGIRQMPYAGARQVKRRRARPVQPSPPPQATYLQAAGSDAVASMWYTLTPASLFALPTRHSAQDHQPLQYPVGFYDQRLMVERNGECPPWLAVHRAPLCHPGDGAECNRRDVADPPAWSGAG